MKRYAFRLIDALVVFALLIENACNGRFEGRCKLRYSNANSNANSNSNSNGNETLDCAKTRQQANL